MRRFLVFTFVLALGLGTASSARANSFSFTRILGHRSSYHYSVIDFAVGTNAVVDMQVTGGAIYDSFLSLFDANGAHIITNNDITNGDPYSNPRAAHIIQNLDAGAYSLLVGSCCTFYLYFTSLGGGYIGGTDGFNTGYFYGGPGITLAGLEAYLDSLDSAYSDYPCPWCDYPYTTATMVSSEALITQVPEPASVMLLGAGVVGFVVHRRKHAHAATIA